MSAVSQSVFDPAQQGTPESEWRATLDAMPTWAPATGRLLIVSPHPDDEVLGAGGLIRQWARNGGSRNRRALTLLSITDGEAAYPDWPGLAQVRRAELNQALATLGGDVRTVGLNVPDGRVDSHTHILRAALAALADDDTTLISPYESDGHPDHDAAGEVCCEFARATGIALARYPIWAWHRSTPAGMPVNWGRFPLPEPTRRAKAAATRCFASQLRPPCRKPIIPDRVMPYFTRPYEAFVLR